MRRLDDVAAGVEHDVRRAPSYSSAARSGGLIRASTSGASCSREIMRVLRPIVVKYCCAARRTAASPSFAFAAIRAMLTMKRGLTP